MDTPKLDEEYLKIGRRILNAPIRTGRNGEIRSLFDPDIFVSGSFEYGFPILKSKQVWMKGVKEELDFFISGETDTKKLEASGVKIWTGNTSEEFLSENGKSSLKPGEMGPMYGFQWRHQGAKYGALSDNPILNVLMDNPIVNGIKWLFGQKTQQASRTWKGQRRSSCLPQGRPRDHNYYHSTIFCGWSHRDPRSARKGTQPSCHCGLQTARRPSWRPQVYTQGVQESPGRSQDSTKRVTHTDARCHPMRGPQSPSREMACCSARKCH